MNKEPSFTYAFALGSCSGALEVLCDHPLFRIKNMLQHQQKIDWNRKALYAGIWPAAACMIPTTAVQIGGNRLIKNALGQEQPMLASILAGGISALVSTPIEASLTYQSSTMRFSQAASQLWGATKLRGFYTGFGGTALREGIFTPSYLIAAPKSAHYLSTNLGWNPTMASISANFAVGAMCALVTQPFDTIKTTQQLAMRTGQKLGFGQTAQQLLGFGLFKGLSPRALRAGLAINLFKLTEEAVEQTGLLDSLK